MAGAVGDAAGDYEERREDDRVAVEDPGEGAEAATAERAADRWEGHVDDEEVEVRRSFRMI